LPNILFGGIVSNMKLKLICLLFLAVAMGGCSSSKPQAREASPKLDESITSGAAFTNSLPFSQAEFIDAVSAFIRAVAPEVKTHGYTVIFTDIGPDNMEQRLPETFQKLAGAASGGGVEVRRYSRMTEEGKTLRDKQTGARGVMLAVHGFAKKAEGNFLIFGAWNESPPSPDGTFHYVLRTVINKDGVWKAQ
jgi:hypothetical protein